MKKTAYAGDIVAEPLKRREGARSTVEAGRETLRRWKAMYGATDISEAGRLKALQDENRRLKAMATNLRLTNETLKAAIQKNG